MQTLSRCLTGHSDLQDSTAKSNVDYGGLAHEVSKENNSNWPLENSCDILTKKWLLSTPVLIFFPEEKEWIHFLVGNFKTA